MKTWRIFSILLTGLMCVAGSHAAEPPKELRQYVVDARTAGLNDAEIEQNAAKAGWPKAVVENAILSTRAISPGESGETKPTAAPAATGKTAEAAKSAETAAPAETGTPAETATLDRGVADKTPNAPEEATVAKARVNTSVPANANTGAGATSKKPGGDHGVPDDYVIGEGDVLHISVWKEPEASVPSLVVRPDGRISMPMLKDVKVSGLTPAEAEKVITEELDKFISAADVTVIVSAIHSKKIYMIGGVKKEEPIPYTYRMTVLQALSEAGGLTDYAKKKKIYVLRHENGKEVRLPFDYDAVVKGQKMELNVPLLPGDTLVVPK